MKAEIVQFETPKKVGLTGLYFGVEKPKRLYIWLHGLTSSCFSKLDIIEKLAVKDTGVLAFNNRGAYTVTRLSQNISATKKKSLMGGSAHEKFTDCIDDIDGAIAFAKSLGAKEIVLVGHSTGCQKAVYWASKKNDPKIKGIVLLAPVSDYLTVKKDFGDKYEKILRYARGAIKKGLGNDLMPGSICPQPLDAHRFISLFTKESVENQVFPYFDSKNPARMLKNATIPILALMGESEEYADRPVEDVLAWFREKSVSCTTAVVPEANHSFKGAETTVATLITSWARDFQ